MSTDREPIDDDLKCLLSEDREIDRIQAKLDLAREAVKEIKEELADALDRRARLSREIRGGCPLFSGLDDADADAGNVTVESGSTTVTFGAREFDAIGEAAKGLRKAGG